MRQEDSDPHDIWKDIVADLERARMTLPDDAAENPAIVQYHQHIKDNEFELACDRLEAYAESDAVTKAFWLALCDAAVKMALYHRASGYKDRAAAGGQ